MILLTYLHTYLLVVVVVVVLVYRLSEERGWELLWLMTGCFAPSTNLLKEVTLFFRSSSANVISLDCLGRLQKTLRSDSDLIVLLFTFIILIIVILIYSRFK